MKENLSHNRHYDQTDTKSAGSFGILAQAVKTTAENRLKRLAEMNIDIEILQPVEIVQVNAADDKRSGNIMIMMLLPLMVHLIAVGGIPAATDLVAGKKKEVPLNLF